MHTIRSKLNRTIRYYDKHGDYYTNKTLFVNLSQLYEPFRAQITRGGRILDAGCGVGRDTRYFIEHGYTVISFDASREMVRRCGEYPHAFCLNMSFEDVNYKEEFDGVWCCGSLLHLKVKEAKESIGRLTTSLKCGGIMFISLKMGEGHTRSQGRFFQYYNETTIQELYNDDSRLELIRMWQTKSLVPTDLDGQPWLNLLLRRK
jgi:2-polyprenyl-3-methyl-5-hydroxy-6-metoxy-1,4-benzoquinol methylase